MESRLETMTARKQVSAVVIGRNEGDRLVACLASLVDQADPIVYVDSGSSDGSIQAASAAGAHIVALDESVPFTAARARNAGMAALPDGPASPAYVQFVDGDCTIDQDWFSVATAFLDNHPSAVAVCGRRRERFPDASVYNWLCDREWDTPVGRTGACGGDALMRLAAVRAVGGYRAEMIAGEEPELCVRLRAQGGEIWRIDADMTRHDAAMTRFGQWWRRTRRGGHAFAEGAALHGAPPERHSVSETRRAVLWGALLPSTALLGTFISPWALALLLAWPLQVLRLGPREGWTRAFFLTLGKVPEAQGVIEYHLRRLTGQRADLIEYKS